MTRASDAPIGILCALSEEQALLVDAIGGPPPLPGRGLEARRGELDGYDVVVAASGVGKVRAATAATLLAERLGCRSLVLSGVAGSLTDEMEIGDIVIADRLIDVDYGYLTDEGRIVYGPDQVVYPDVVPDPDPSHRLPAALVERIEARLETAGLAVTLGTILTGDAFLASSHMRDRLAGEWSALAIEMEGSAVAGVASRFGIPWLVVRALSDRAGEESLVDFRAFVASAAERSAELVRALLPVFDD